MAKLVIPDPGTPVIYNDGGVEFGARVVPAKGYTPTPDDGRVDLAYLDKEWLPEGFEDGEEVVLPDGKLHTVAKGRNIHCTAVPHEDRVDPGENVRFWRYPQTEA